MRKLLVVMGILVVVGLGFWFISNMTGGVITGVVVGDEVVVVNEYFQIDNSSEVNKTGDLNGTQNNSG